MRLILVIASLLFSQIVFADEIKIAINNNTKELLEPTVAFSPVEIYPPPHSLEAGTGIIYTANLDDWGSSLSKPFLVNFRVYARRDWNTCTVKNTLSAVGIKNPILEININYMDSYEWSKCVIEMNVKEDSE